jgi:hypothetical protein
MYTNGFITFKVLMIRSAAICFFVLLFSWDLHAQYGNEWIQYGQQYVKIPVASNGLYKVPFSALAAAGLPLSDPAKLQLFHRGTEHSLIVGADYIEFYGTKNDGVPDRELYEQEVFQPHQYYNLFADTTNYFLTVGNADGKRISAYQEDNISLSPEPYFLTEHLQVLASSYSPGKDYGSIYKTTFDEGEGWMGPEIRQGEAIRYDTMKGLIRGAEMAGNPVVEFAVTGRGYMDHAVEVYIGAPARLLTTFVLKGFETRKLAYEVEWSDITANELRVGIKVNTVNATTAKVSLNYLKMTFPQETDLAGNPQYFFTLPPNVGGKSYIELANPPDNARLFDITDPVHPQEVGAVKTATLNALIRSTSASRALYAASTAIEPEIKKVAFTPIDPLNFDYIIITHALLRKPAGGYSDPVQAYAEYRASTEGGEHAPLLLNVDQIYDQFNYGEQSPLAIFHLIRFLSSVRIPAYLFLIGKGLDPDYDYYRNPGVATEFKSLVPAAGMPGSDMAYSAGLDGIADVPAIATGRLTAMRPEEVAAYLDKVKETEARPFNDLRRKNLLHLSGGIYAGEAQVFRSFLQEFAATAKGYYLGGEVEAIAKESTDIKLINISKEVNDGVNLVTFFGHSSAVTLDFDVGKVTDDVMGYRNKGKYPVMIMNGCQAGSFFRYAELFGENWIHAKDRGAVGFIAHSSLGIVSLLRKYTGIFYEVGYGDSSFIEKGLGDIQKEVARRYLTAGANSPADITQVQQMVLLGDPAVPLFGARDPDYAIRDENLSITTLDEQPVTAASDSFAIKFIVRNYGKAESRPLAVQVLRTLPDRSTVTYDSLYPPVLYADTLTFIVHGKLEGSGGNNSFEIRLDAGQAISELRENNNAGYIDYFIPENGTKNLYPVNFAIVNRAEIALSFQHTDLHSPIREFILEIDTINTFDSPYRKNFVVSAPVLGRQPVVLLAEDTLVYYWRTKLADPLPNESKSWTVSSFTYVANGSEGWMQGHFPQYMSNKFNGFVPDTLARKFRFEENTVPVFIRTFGSESGRPVQDVSLQIDSVEYNLFGQGFGCRNNTINLVAFDRSSTVPYQGVRFQWFNSGGRSCGREPWAINSFLYNEMVTGNGDDVIQYVDNIPAGDSVVLFSIGDASYQLWPEAAKIKLGELGISLSQINDLVPGEPVAIFGRKGLVPGTARLFRGESPTPASDELEVSGSITGRFTSGGMQSGLIGPALSWSTVFFDIAEADDAETAAIDIYGILKNGGQVLLVDSIYGSRDLSTIDAGTYPYLRLVFKSTDDVNLTPVQLDRWIVTFEPVPEGLIIYKGPAEQVVLQEGLPWIGQYGFINVGDQEFTQPITVNYKLVNNSSLTTDQYNIAIPPPAPGDTTLFDIMADTFEKRGLHDIEVFVNPYVAAEQYYDNNVFILRDHLRVFGESFSPVIDVVFDGRYISKDEYVSADPQIVITLWDENRILLKDDTTGIEMYLSYPCETEPCDFRRINFSGTQVHWYPATDTSQFRAEFNPGVMEPGRYVLRVNGYDQSGNSSGDNPYEISFRVSGENIVELSGIFPNPMRDRMNFNLILTEHVDGNYVSLELVGSDGHHTRSFTIPATSLHVGTNTLSLGFNGLAPAPGIYIYRLTFSGNGKRVERKGKIALVY